MLEYVEPIKFDISLKKKVHLLKFTQPLKQVDPRTNITYSTGSNRLRSFLQIVGLPSGSFLKSIKMRINQNFRQSSRTGVCEEMSLSISENVSGSCLSCFCLLY